MASRGQEHPQHSARTGTSARFRIKIFDPQTRAATYSDVRSHLGDVEVTEEMVKQDVAALNHNAGLGGTTGRKIQVRRSVYTLETLQ